MTLQSSPEGTSQTEQPIVVVLDANAWIDEWMLNSFAGASLVDFLAQSKGKLLLPEIVEEELRRGISKRAQSAGDKIAAEIDRLNKLIRREIAFNSPSSAVIETAIKTNLGELEPLLIRCAFTFEHAKDALNRIYLGRPPCGQNNEQFRDACIWQDCVTYGKDNTVFFVTADLAFYDAKKSENGLAKELREEITAARADVRIFPSIGKLYDHLTPAIAERDTREIAEKITQKLRRVIDESLGRHGFSDAQLSGQSISLKVTGVPTRQFGTFTLTFTLSSAIEDNERLAPTLTLEGTCSFDVPSGNVHDVSLDREIVAWTAPDGKPVQAGTHHIRAHLATGAYASTGISFG
jgi:rRNA-processing protein FCF1